MSGWEEHRDHMMGEASELQNALTLSRLEQKPDDRQKAAELVAAGKFVLVSDYPAYCPRTDALMGIVRQILSVHDTHEDGVKALHSRAEDSDPDERVHLMWDYKPPTPEERKAADTGDEIPF
jgi:hypothetical protein